MRALFVSPDKTKRWGRTMAVAVMVASSWLILAESAHAADWPQLKLPKELQVFDAGQEVVLNGLPMRLSGFVSSMPAPELVRILRQSLGEPLVVDQLGSKTVLGRGEGKHYLTVQVERAGEGSRGVIAVTHLQAAYEAQANSAQERRDWSDRLPSGTTVHSYMKSLDDMQQSRQLVYSNRQGEAFNRDRLLPLLEREGFQLEHEQNVDGEPGGRFGPSLYGRVLFFKGMGKNGMATINRESDGQTFVVLNLINVLESYP